MRLNSKENISRNLIWRLMERFGAQGVSFIVSLFLARLLYPEDYGLIAMSMVFISILNVFVDSGLGNALIQKKDADDLDFSTVFYFNLFFCVLLYALLFFCAPLISSFYNMDTLTPVVRVLGLTVINCGVKNIQQAYVARHMMFKKFFFSTLGGTLGAAAIGIVMAYCGFGVWALVAQHTFNLLVDTVILWIAVRWRPKRMFSFARLKVLFSYGWKLLVSRMIDTIYEDIRSLVIVKMYTPSDLGFYNRGKQFPFIIVDNLNASIDSVLFPSLSMEQDDISRVRAMTSRSIRITSYVVMPLMAGLAACAAPLVNLVLTAKWAECVPYLQIFCVGYALVPVSTANLNAIKAIGRSDIYLKLEIIRKVINTVTLVASMWFGVLWIALSYLANCVFNLIVNAAPNKRLLRYGYGAQLRDLLPAVLLSTGMGAIVYAVSWLGLSDWLTLLIQVPLGVLVYVLGSKLFKVDSFTYILDIVKKKRAKKEEEA